jgi:hypothetical protein
LTLAREPERITGSPRWAAALGAAAVVLAIAASGCGEGLKNAVDTAKSLQSRGTSAAGQAQQQVQSVENQIQQQATQNSSGGNYGY